MIEKTLKTTTGRLRVKIPTQLSEVTLGQMMQLQEKQDLNDLEAIGILSGVPVTDLQNICSMDDLQVFGDYVLSLSHQITHLYNSEAIPERVTLIFDDKPVTVKVMSNLSVEPAGAFMAARDVIADEINYHIEQYGEEEWQANFNPSLKACCQVLAHYFYCRATGKPYNEYGAEDFCITIKNIGVTEALPIAKHFFTCYPSLSKPKTNFWHRLHRHWKKKLACRRLKSLNTLTP
jgi:hypothetical protein